MADFDTLQDPLDWSPADKPAPVEKPKETKDDLQSRLTFMTDEEIRARHPEIAPPEPKPVAPKAEAKPEPEAKAEEKPKPFAFDDSRFMSAQSGDQENAAPPPAGTFSFDDSKYGGSARSRNRFGSLAAGEGQIQSTIFPISNVVRVIDGDTVVVRVNDQGKMKEVKVRLPGIDAPEYLPGLPPNHPGTRAKQALEKLLSSGQLLLSGVHYDPKTDRHVADIQTTSVKSVAHWMKDNGFATSWFGYPAGWPKGNEWRKLWQSMPIEDTLKYKEIAALSRRMGQMEGQFGHHPNRDIVQAASGQFKKFMDEYVWPWRERTHGKAAVDAMKARLAQSGQQQQSAPVQRDPSQMSPDELLKQYWLDQRGRPQAQAGPQSVKDFVAQHAYDKPSGRGEFESWRRTLWPNEQQHFNNLKRELEAFKQLAPRTAEERRAWFADPEYVRLNKAYERFMDQTTKRWRQYRNSHPQSQHRSHRRRYAEGTGGVPDPQGVRQMIASDWGSAGMSQNGIKGIIANVADESGFNPTLRHADQPRFTGEAHFAHGLYQEGGSEWNRYAGWLRANHPNADWRDPRLQNRFTALNLKANYPRVWSAMQQARTPGEAATAFLLGYLKPAQHFARARANKYRNLVEAETQQALQTA